MQYVCFYYEREDSIYKKLEILCLHFKNWFISCNKYAPKYY